MKLFQDSQKNFAILGINSNQQRSFNGNSVITYVVNGLGLISCAVFFFFEANTFQEYSNNAYVTTAIIVSITVFTNMVFQTEALFKLINKLEEYFEKRSENPASRAHYEETSQLIEKCSVVGFFVMGKVTPVCWVFPLAIICYFKYFISDLGNAAFVLPVFTWFPFDWKNPFGYLIAVIFQYIVASYAFMLAGVLITFGFGFFLLTLAALKEATDKLKKINDFAKFEQNRLETLDRLGDFIDFHGRAIQIVHEFVEIYQPVFMILAVSSLVLICGVLLSIQIEIKEQDALVLFVTIFYASYAFGIILIICELGQRITDAFGQIADEIESSDWIEFPHEIQRMLPNILIIAQQPIEFECFGSISGVRETFKKVVKSAFSYFLTIRKFL